MSKKRSGSDLDKTPELPGQLVRAMLLAKEGVSAHPTLTEEEMIPNLFGVMSPMLVSDPRYKGEGKPPKAVREPLLMISWDRRNGAWKASITDKVLNISCSVIGTSLLTILADLEAALAADTVRWGARKVT